MNLIPVIGGVALASAGPAFAIAQPAAPSPKLFPDSQLVVRDRISVEVVGKGPDLMFIPGLASSRATWKASAARLRGRYRLHLVQVAGFAGEPARGNAAGPVLVPAAEAIAAYLKDAHLAPATLVGHSLGGTMILWLAENRPEVVRRALIVDSLPFFATVMMGPTITPAAAKPIAEGIRNGPPAPETRMKAMIAGMVTSEADRAMVGDWSRASDAGVVKNALADDLELDLRPGLSQIRAPITLLYPDYAAVGVPPGATDASYGAAYKPLPGVRIKRVDKSLHFIMLDQPAAFAADLDAFLAEAPR